MDDSLWTHCLRRLESELPEQHFNTWIRPLQAVEDRTQLRLLAPNRYVVEWVNQNCAARIAEMVEEMAPAPPPQVYYQPAPVYQAQPARVVIESGYERPYWRERWLTGTSVTVAPTWLASAGMKRCSSP